ncbi:hypothetical protein SAMN02745150_01195 [Brevinema andersonii]|uniref:Phage baseplate assembly protein V n=1 Tax=Brevinema andersonii TaxID=34097 RepID=A0A1I1END9_BREAD|nr:hypothetical protein [Brevinema andersonii]SFB88621.1 hypothetical protein SAMN02745150_01195 [Brevinema andersonii]
MILEQLETVIRNIIEEYAFPVLAKVSSIDTKNYTCDCKELTNTGEETETVYTRVSIPKFWGTAQGGVWMSPSKGAIVLLNFLNGDRNDPIIAAVMGTSTKENAPEDTLMVKSGNSEIRMGSHIKIRSGTTKIALNSNGTIGIKNSDTSLAQLLKDIVSKISLVKTVDGKSLSPDDVTKLQALSVNISRLLDY